MLKVEKSKMVCHQLRGPGCRQPTWSASHTGVRATERVRKGAFTDAKGPNLRLLEWSLPEDADITDPKVAKQATPRPGSRPRCWLRRRRLCPNSLIAASIAANGQNVQATGYRQELAACIGTPNSRTARASGWTATSVARSQQPRRLAQRDLHVSCGSATATGRPRSERTSRRTRSNIRAPRVHLRPLESGQLAKELQERGINVSEFRQSDSRMCPRAHRLYGAIVHDASPCPTTRVPAALSQHSRTTLTTGLADRHTSPRRTRRQHRRLAWHWSTPTPKPAASSSSAGSTRCSHEINAEEMHPVGRVPQRRSTRQELLPTPLPTGRADEAPAQASGSHSDVR